MLCASGDNPCTLQRRRSRVIIAAGSIDCAAAGLCSRGRGTGGRERRAGGFPGDGGEAPRRAAMPGYETTIMMSTATSRKRTVDLLKRVVEHVLDKKGVVTSINSLGTRALAYDIKKHKQTHSTANYAILNTYASPGTLKEAHKLLQHDADVIRFMTIRLSR